MCNFETTETIMTMIENDSRFNFEWAVMDLICIHDTETNKVLTLRIEEIND